MHKTVPELAKRWLGRQPAAISEREHRILQSAVDRTPIASDPDRRLAQGEKAGDRIADAIARVGGSWSFILSFLVFLVLWTFGNGFLLASGGFDPYPFIFLNLVLSMLAALQAPIIMMSQNRAAQRDRVDAMHDYEVNLKSEIEIMALHEKFDEMRHQQMLGMREDIARIADRLDRIERRLSQGPS